MGRRRFAATAMAALLTGALAPSALAQGPDPDVIVDPDSPSAKEYAIPLAKARTEAAGDVMDDGATARRPAAATPLFGVGIAIKQPAQARQPRKIRRRATPKAPEMREERPRTEEPKRAVAPRNVLRQAASPDTGVGDLAMVGAGGGALLLLGGLLGAAMRRRTR